VPALNGKNKNAYDVPCDAPDDSPRGYPGQDRRNGCVAFSQTKSDHHARLRIDLRLRPKDGAPPAGVGLPLETKDEALAMTMPTQTCWGCAYFTFIAADPGYSEYTPGSDFMIDCQKRMWKEGRRELGPTDSYADFTKAMEIGFTCPVWRKR
jgi:hypothetical protein